MTRRRSPAPKARWLAPLLALAAGPAHAAVDLDRVSEGFAGGSPLSMRWGVLLAGLVLSLIGAAYLVQWLAQWGRRSHPWWLFWRASGLAGLGPIERLLLARVARRQGLPSALTLLLSSRTLRVHGEAFVSELHASRRAAAQRRLARIHTAVFGRPGATDSTPGDGPRLSPA